MLSYCNMSLRPTYLLAVVDRYVLDTDCNKLMTCDVFILESRVRMFENTVNIYSQPSFIWNFWDLGNFFQITNFQISI